jgi:predicted phage-related endonuclease
MRILAETSTLSDEQIQEIRAGYLGASELADALTYGPSRVILRKMGLLERDPDNERMYFGRRLEPLVVEEVKRRIEADYPGAEVSVSPAKTIFQHKRHDFMTASPDAFIVVKQSDFPYSEELGVLEAKTAQPHTLAAWEEGPTEYSAWQVQDQMEVCGEPVAYGVVGAFIPYTTRYHLIERERAAADACIEMAEKIWACVETRTLPDLATIDLEQIKRAYPNATHRHIELPDRAVTIIEDYEQSKVVEREARSRARKAEAALRALLQDAELGEVAGRKVWCKEVRSRRLREDALKQYAPEVWSRFAAVESYRRLRVE